MPESPPPNPSVSLWNGFFPPETTYCDYGCGHGADIEYIHPMGLTNSGWDPYFHPDVPRTQADVVNLGYVINVIDEYLKKTIAARRRSRQKQ